jgi:23S rRNA (cytosine1962-C5)-methyltransferase
LKPGIEILCAPIWSDYELLDCGDGQKLERFGRYKFIRPEPQAMWSKKLDSQQWAEAHAEFKPTTGDETGGRWRKFKQVDDTWKMSYKSLVFEARITNSRHFGVFPEQAVQWNWMVEKIQSSGRPIKILNLFGYTGLATLAAAHAGAGVTHVDASKKAVSWARANQVQSGLHDKPIRWIVEDVFKFVQREERRGTRYDGIVMDPPKFGRGPKGEVWDSLDMLPDLLAHCRNLLTPSPLFIIITAYAIRASSLSLYYLLSEKMKSISGHITCGELAIGEAYTNRIISSAIFTRWSG